MMHSIHGDLFEAPAGAILAHACNCMGFWGGGIAAAFSKRFPLAYEIYHKECTQYQTVESKRENLLGTCFLIPSVDVTGREYTVACLFTSIGGGFSRDSVPSIIKSTDLAITDLKRQLLPKGVSPSSPPSPIHMPRINSGIFGVPWPETEAVLLKHLDGLEVVVHGL